MNTIIYGELKFTAPITQGIIRVRYEAGKGWSFTPWLEDMDEWEFEWAVNYFWIVVYDALLTSKPLWPGLYPIIKTRIIGLSEGMFRR